MPQRTPILLRVHPASKEVGWVKRHDIIKAFTQRSVLDESNLATLDIIVWNLATVDASGVIISTRVDICKPSLYLVGYDVFLQYIYCTVSIIHIGVGSDVVCSTNKASMLQS